MGEKAALLDDLRALDPALAEAGGGPVDIEVREIGGEGRPADRFLVFHLLVDVRDAMGANLVNTMGEALAPMLEAATGGRAGLSIVSNLADRRLVTVEAFIPCSELALGRFDGENVRDGIVAASRFAELDPYRAATHNKGLMNGLDAVLLATGNDWRAVEAGAHAFAARRGIYGPLCVWTTGPDSTLAGRVRMPMAVGTVGGAATVHPTAELALELMSAGSATKLAAVAASAGMACNLAALRALSTEGIQKGHMRLHGRKSPPPGKS